MQRPNTGKFRLTKSLALLGVTALLVLGFFVYKYSYIYLERRKYDKAAVAIQQVADDLRAQGINTEFSRGCGRTQEVYGKGTLTCDVGIIYRYKGNNEDNKRIIKLFISSLRKRDFNIINNMLGTSAVRVATGTATMRLVGTPLTCALTFSEVMDSSQFDLGCGDSSKFSLF